jgi:hypothetical protein
MRCEHTGTPLPRGLTTSILRPQSHLFHLVVSYQDDIYSLFRLLKLCHFDTYDNMALNES